MEEIKGKGWEYSEERVVVDGKVVTSRGWVLFSIILWGTGKWEMEIVWLCGCGVMVMMIMMMTLIMQHRPGTAMLFALTIVEVICGKEKRDEVAGPMVVAQKLWIVGRASCRTVGVWDIFTWTAKSCNVLGR
jgi:protein DJ-1